MWKWEEIQELLWQERIIPVFKAFTKIENLVTKLGCHQKLNKKFIKA